MAVKLFQLLFFLFLFSSFIHAHSSSFSFTKCLEGSHKGSKIAGILKLKKYLEKFGYLQYGNKPPANDDDFDETLVSAIKTYQRNLHLKPTGVLDAKTVSTMMKPRCSVADIINGTNYMQSREDEHDSGSVRTVSRYSFFPGRPRWPASKYQLTYKFVTTVTPEHEAAVDTADQKWAEKTHITFLKTKSPSRADCTIGFYKGWHGDFAPFDGPFGVLAHAYSPTDGRLHFDAAERWAVGAVPNTIDVVTVGAHEIGHQIGLGHSNVRAALMWPSDDNISIMKLQSTVSKCPGTDGFNFPFLRNHWDVLKVDYRISTKNGRLSKGINSTFITPTHKISNPVSLDHFRPISFVSSQGRSQDF